ncbi:hypothetical protein HO133_006056 [Letharia lupina]|uniref:UDP-glucose:glycoprotein glucosyltransferase n=1 Tax=Letharia lupina TaxID=560253 RepID=A0A8H6F842_9LECA|nr:uncharacterized protein HO133_006056 [Letharia lupina]KAF6218705.1 hypothetical protein HO133_006056 [Letharia lupina]
MRLSLLPSELLGLLIVSSSFTARHAFASPTVNVALQASFNAPPYILELLETAAEENSTAYFPILDRIAEGRFADYNSDQELYSTFLQVLQDDGHITNAEALSSFQFALSIHSAAPRIEAHYHYYDTSVEPSLMIAQDAACPVWVHFDGKQYCSPALDRAQQDVGALKNPESLPFDRVLGVSSKPAQAPSILYADITSPLFGQFHQTISSTARNGQTSYRIRYRPSQSHSAKPLAVNGYGIELALKRTDYIVIDDRSAGSEEAEDQGLSAGNEAAAGEFLLESEEVADLKPLSSKELLGLGLKTASFIMASDDPFDTLVKVSQDFPKHSSAITKRNASTEFVKEHSINRNVLLPAGYNVIWMNGMQVQARQMDAFGLLEQLRRERSIVDSLRGIGFSGLEAVQILTHEAIASSKKEGDTQRYDYRDDLEGGNIIVWLNDIEKDKRYSGWPTHTSALLQRTYPGQLPQVRRDIHNVIIPLDLTDMKDVELLVESLQTFVKRKIPIRFGIVPMTTSAAAIDQAKIVYHLLDTYGLSAVFAYLEASITGKRVSLAQKAIFDSTIKDRSLRRDQSVSEFQTILDGTESQSRVQSTKEYLKRLGADGTPAPLFANGVAMPRNEAWLQTMSQSIDMDLRTIQRQIYEEVIPEDTWLAGQYLEKAITHRNALIIPEDENSIVIIDIAKLISKHGETVGKLPRLMGRVDGHPSEQGTAQLLVVADLDSENGSDLLMSAVSFCQEHEDIELLFVHNGANSDFFPHSVMFWEQMKDGHRNLDIHWLESTLNIKKVLGQTKEQDNSLNSRLDKFWNAEYSREAIDQANDFWQSFSPVIQTLGFQPGQQALMVNGRIVGPIPKDTNFTASDFGQLFQFERSKRIDPANAALTALFPGKQIEYALDAAILSSTIALSTISDVPEGIFESAPTLRMNKFDLFAGNHTMIQTGDVETSSIHLVASIDPTSEIAQRWIPILKVLSELNGVHLKLYLNPKEKMKELPVKRFYRHVLDAKPTFTEDGDLRDLKATFSGLPKDALLNLALDVPPAWLVAPKESVHDLDNIKLSALKEGVDVDAIYELEHILIEGHSRDVTVGPPPRGVQLYLGTEKDPHFADTIIMANLGYFQFKANPGYWKIQLQPGRSEQIFHIDSAGQQGYNPQPGDESTDITLMSFQGKTLYPRLSRKPGQEAEDVLEESVKPGTPMEYLSKASKFASSLLNSVGLAPSAPKHADINIFSVASGHLYERMLNIMMVSVMRHTQHTVKFWFIEQFLSPSFKASLPTLAAHYNFQYSLITYKWPHWLRAQSEKQREIWGYKILFLDVLFPTSLDKVIFVDADQIVRTDMYDLVTHDLEGAAYGFTPMCDSRTSMEGFRFWKTGYWANFLRGRPYHISALYVVDLVKFREMAAGDRLRQQYHQLSADPASLSNLDQDLPNHMQHVLPIHSLPQRWLWCETWCSDESLTEARTIDLCNNPETKEPKLSRARRQVPEWTGIDEEVARVFADAGGRGAKMVAEGGGESVQEVLQEEDEERKRKERDEL